MSTPKKVKFNSDGSQQSSSKKRDVKSQKKFDSEKGSLKLVKALQSSTKLVNAQNPKTPKKPTNGENEGL
jgi:hypothetical protein